jgi:hypothetical protein
MSSKLIVALRYRKLPEEGTKMSALRLFGLVLIFSLATIAEEHKTPKGWDANTIQWQTTNPDGTKWAVLEGKADATGQPFTYAAFIPAGYRSQHSHSSDARVAVAQGVLKIGFGEGIELNHLTSILLGVSYMFQRTWSMSWPQMSIRY